jgi:murein biosynthesis integral membrane protein MurJ
MGSALASKFLGFLRDRFLVDFFSEGAKIDFVFAAFRIPDFFFFLLVGGTVATLFLPRAADLNGRERMQFFSSFFWGVVIIFGFLCGLGALFPEFFVGIFVSGFERGARVEIAELAQLLFGSVFLLAVSAVFSASMQLRERFLSVALAPILYTGAIAAGIYFFAERYGLPAVGYAAIAGALLHLLTNVIAFFAIGNRIGLYWKKPRKSWERFSGDFSARLATSAAFQISQSADVWIASFLMVGTVGAFSIGANWGHVLLSIVGMPLANAAFPKFSKQKNNFPAQKIILRHTLNWIFLATIPTSIIGVFFASDILRILFDLSGTMLHNTALVFSWIIASLPLACTIPVLARVFFANDDVRTPMKIWIVSLGLGTATAAILALQILPPERAILGLALGTFVTNTLSAVLFAIATWRKYFHPTSCNIPSQ